MSTTKKKSPLLLGILLSLVLCGLCFIIALPLSRGQSLFPASSAKGPESRAQKYADEYNGAYDAYLAIFTSSDCEYLQGQFENAYELNNAVEPGTIYSKQSLGFMTAANERMQEIGCYDQ